MDERLIGLLDALDGVRLLPQRHGERGVVYGYVAVEAFDAAVGQLIATLAEQHYEVHRCAWRGDIVLLALQDGADPLAIRLTSAADERYNLYALSRPQSSQTLWQWAQVTARQAHRRRES
jgi:hypothetical protein